MSSFYFYLNYFRKKFIDWNEISTSSWRMVQLRLFHFEFMVGWFFIWTHFPCETFSYLLVTYLTFSKLQLYDSYRFLVWKFVIVDFHYFNTWFFWIIMLRGFFKILAIFPNIIFFTICYIGLIFWNIFFFIFLHSEFVSIHSTSKKYNSKIIYYQYSIFYSSFFFNFINKKISSKRKFWLWMKFRSDEISFGRNEQHL